MRHRASPLPNSSTVDRATIRAGLRRIIRGLDASGTHPPADARDDETILPAYGLTSPLGSLSLSSSAGHVRTDSGPPLSELSSSSSNPSHSQSFLEIESHETFPYIYDLFVGNTHVQIFISVELDSETPNDYTFSLSIKVGHVERAVSKPITMRLSVDPRRLDFVVFVYSPQTSLPAGCLYNLRVWLRTARIDHRLFGEKDLWFGRDPEFGAIPDASFAHLRNAAENMLVYQGSVGRAQVTFIFRWTHLDTCLYALSLDYDAGGAGKTLFDAYPLRLHCAPQAVSFLIYSIPVPSTPPGASHRLRVWLRTPHAISRARALSSSSPSPSPSLSPSTSTSYIYQRLWKLDDFKIGAQLGFEAVGKIVLASRVPSLGAARSPLTPNRRPVPWMATDAGVDGGVGTVYDR